jgi:hypothetical protein
LQNKLTFKIVTQYLERLMKKILVVLSLMLTAFSFQANAASLSWTSAPLDGTAAIFGGDPTALLGVAVVPKKGTSINHAWTFAVTGGSMNVGIQLTDIPSWLKSATFGSFDLLASNFTGVLAAGSYTINLIGKTVGANSSYSLRVAETPIPAAVWLFGSALMGLVGVKRRQVA